TAGGAPALRLVDVGTGSGAIALALALAKELPSAEIYATDISEEALEVARANAARHELAPRIHFHRADLLAGVALADAAVTGKSLVPVSHSAPLPQGEFDFVVSNPPYVGEAEEDQVQLEVRKFEPRTAVFAGSTGLEVIERLIPQAREALRPGGWLVFEISGTIAEGVQRLLSGWDQVAITNDLQGIARVARASKATRG
ncbi:MAG: HemK/PrmC family methyltransferase, partial [Terriglobales bacterium]